MMAALGSMFVAMVLMPIGKWFVANGLNLALKFAPLAVLLIAFGVGWYTGTPWVKVDIVAIAISAFVLALDIVGSLEPAGK